MKPLKPHQQAWLDAHSDRSEEWLRDAFAEGFDIHHIDGNPDNNSPHNLVLIETRDHMRLHGGGTLRKLYRTGQRWGEVRGTRDHTSGWMLYEGKKHGATWRKLAKVAKLSQNTALQRAKSYAQAFGEIWPIKGI